MFGWMNRKRLAEQEKLLRQNMIASMTLCGRYNDKGNMQGVNDCMEIATMTAEIERAIPDGGFASVDQATALFNLNMELRRMFEHSGAGTASQFDKTYAPPA